MPPVPPMGYVPATASVSLEDVGRACTFRSENCGIDTSKRGAFGFERRQRHSLIALARTLVCL